MPAFTFTAPFISFEEARAEREALDTASQQELHDDLYGTHIPLEENEQMIESALALFQSILDNDIAESDKQAYCQAAERVPDLVKRESPPLAYLRCERFNAPAAVRRFVQYWTIRMRLFGPERAFRPMTLLSGSAMEPDIQYLEKAVFWVLPDDEHGRSVIFADRIRCIAAIAPRDACLRCLFYTLQSIVRNTDAPRKGAVVLGNLRGYDLYTHYDRIQTKQFVAISHVFPFYIRAAHAFTGSGKSVMEVVFPILMHIVGKYMRMRFLLYAGSSSEVLARVKEYGINRDHISVVYDGGLLTSSRRVRAWMENRRQVEMQEETATAAAAVAAAAAASRREDDTVGTTVHGSLSSSSSMDTSPKSSNSGSHTTTCNSNSNAISLDTDNSAPQEGVVEGVGL